MQRQMLGNAAKQAGKLIPIGSLVVACGLVGLIAEVAFSYATVSFLGAFVLFSGVLMAVHAFQPKGWPPFLIQSLFAALYLGLGFFVWFAPTTALQGLTIWLAAPFLVIGAMRLIASYWVLGLPLAIE